MTRFFFYGTLLDHDVLALVIARRLPPSAFAPAVLPGHSRRRVRGETYPIAVHDPGDEVAGMVVSGLTTRDVARLSAYEGPNYRIASLKVRTASGLTAVSVFKPLEQCFEALDVRWDPGLWRARDKRPFVDRLRRTLNVRPAYSRR